MILVWDVDPLMRQKNLYVDEMFQTTAEAESEGLDPVKTNKNPSSPRNLLLSFPKWYFCCGALVLHGVMSACIWSRAILVS